MKKVIKNVIQNHINTLTVYKKELESLQDEAQYFVTSIKGDCFCSFIENVKIIAKTHPEKASILRNQYQTLKIKISLVEELAQELANVGFWETKIK